MKRILQELSRAFLIGVVVFIVIAIVRYYNGYRITSVDQLMERFIYNQVYSIMLYGSNAIFIFYLVKKYKSDIFKLRHLIKGILGGIVITFGSIFVLRFINGVLVYGTDF